MSYHVYALKSTTRNYIYVGLTSDICRRFSEHNSGHERTTRAYRPFQLIYKEAFPDRKSARQREIYLKSGIGKEYLRRHLILIAELVDLPAGRQAQQT